MIRSLEQRLLVFLLLPVACLLLLTGFMGFFYARDVMLREWREAAILRLERAAHHLDMRLSQPVQWIHIFHRTSEDEKGPIVQEWVLGQLHRVEGVTGVELKWLHNHPEAPATGMPRQGNGGDHGIRFHKGRISEVTSPKMDPRTGEKTVDLISELRDESGEAVGRLQVSLSFDYLMQDLLKLGWGQSDQACLVDDSGHYLAHTTEMAGRGCLAETGDAVEASILEDMKVKPFGTVLIMRLRRRY